jgi:hypothetical protein
LLAVGTFSLGNRRMGMGEWACLKPDPTTSRWPLLTMWIPSSRRILVCHANCTLTGHPPLEPPRRTGLSRSAHRRHGRRGCRTKHSPDARSRQAIARRFQSPGQKWHRGDGTRSAAPSPPRPSPALHGLSFDGGNSRWFSTAWISLMPLRVTHAAGQCTVTVPDGAV